MKKAITSISKQPIFVEMAEGEFWGRVDINDNLIIEFAPSLEILKNKIRKTITNIERANVEAFEVSFDLSSFFEQYSFLNISDIAKKANISPVIMRQYSAGIKFPSKDRVKEIELAIREIGKELAKVKLHKKTNKQI